MPSLTIQDDFKFGNWFHWKVVLLGCRCGFMFGLTIEYLVFSCKHPKWLVNMVGKEQHKVRRSKNNAHKGTIPRRVWWKQIVI